VPLACLFALTLIVAAVGVCARAAAPACAAALPSHAIWSDVLGGTTNTESWIDVARGPDGSLYAGGSYDTVPMGSTGDLLVARFSRSDAAAKHRLWSRTWDNPVEHLDDRLWAIAVDHSGAVVAAGTTHTAHSGVAWVIAKWNRSGSRRWAETFAASPLTAWDAWATDVACDAAGNVYVCGMVQKGESDGNTVASLVVRKLSGADGHVIWQGSYAGALNSYNQGSKLALDAAGNVYCTGYGQSAQGDDDIITCKFVSTTGRLSWARRIADTKHLQDEGTAIVVRGAHVWVTGGEYADATDRVVGLAKYTLAGKRLWLRTWLERADTLEYPEALAVDGHDNAVVVGSGNDNPVTRDHAFILHYSAAGVLQWRRIAYDSVSHEAEWHDVVCDAAGRIWVGGDTVMGSATTSPSRATRRPEGACGAAYGRAPTAWAATATRSAWARPACSPAESSVRPAAVATPWR
jgi:hypothetical protein